MKALRYVASVPRYVLARAAGKRYPVSRLPLKLVEVPVPAPPPGWVRVRVQLCGICGSDISLLYGKNSPRLSPFFSFPAVLGHEILGETDGKRVVVNPILACRERGLPPCSACAQGEDGLCENVARGQLSPGMLGYCRDLPGGWGEWIVAHSDRIYPVPDGVPDERAVLVEPASVIMRGLRIADSLTMPKILVIGAGTIGLLTVAGLRLLGFGGEIHVAAKYPLGATLARELGADRVYPSAWEAARAIGSRSWRALLGPPAWRGGFPLVIDAAGSQTSLDQAAWTVREGGRILLLGAPGVVRHDFSPYWFRSIEFRGTYTYAEADFRRAVELLPKAAGIERLITNVFPLSDWQKALETAVHHRGIKVVFTP